MDADSPPDESWRHRATDVTKLADEEQRRLLLRLREEIAAAERPPGQLLVSIKLSQILGSLRPVKRAHGCEIPLNFDGIPARTVFGQQDDWIFDLQAAPTRDPKAVVVDRGKL